MKISTRPVKNEVAKEEMQTERDNDLYANLSSIDSELDSLVLHYKQLAKDFPQYREMFEGLAASALTQKGTVSALRDDVLYDSEASALDQGEQAAKYMLDAEPTSVTVTVPMDTDEAILSLINGSGCCSTESATEDVEGGTTKEQIVDWLAQHEQAARDFANFFSGKVTFTTDGELIADDSLTAEEIEGWIYDHEELSQDYQSYFADDEQGEEYIIFAKESEDLEEAFLEYRYPDKLMAQGTFFGSQVPTALLSKDKNTGKWKVEAMTAECSEPALKEMLDEQIELLNA
ncbi:MAG: hypothetical protein NC218_01370 [Acetobacter sp.]|nr:hypothetical protein [Acetobacter sp.]